MSELGRGIDPPVERALQHQPKTDGEDGGQKQCRNETNATADQSEGDIAADHGKTTMGQIGYAHHP